jgi:hypothetical protein
MAIDGIVAHSGRHCANLGAATVPQSARNARVLSYSPAPVANSTLSGSRRPGAEARVPAAASTLAGRQRLGTGLAHLALCPPELALLALCAGPCPPELALLALCTGPGAEARVPAAASTLAGRQRLGTAFRSE